MEEQKEMKIIRCAGGCGRNITIEVEMNSGLCRECTDNKVIQGEYFKLSPNERARRSCRIEGAE